MKDKIEAYNRKHNLQFDEAAHRYTIEGDIELQSVTTKLKQFFPFDVEAISKKVAEMRGISQDELKAQWKKTADDGTEVHLLAEKYALGHKLNSEELNKIKHAVAFFEQNPQLEVVDCEVKVFSKKYKVAGTADLLVKHKETGKLYLLDYKTCKKEIDKNSVFRMADGVLKDYPNNKYYAYSMQVSVYSYILREEYGIDVHDSMLIHLRSDDTYTVIQTEDMQMLVEDVLK